MPLVLVIVAVALIVAASGASRHRREAEQAARAQALAMLWALRSIRAEAHQLPPPEPLCAEPEQMGAGCLWTLVLAVLLALAG
jgi:hypothetical protein